MKELFFSASLILLVISGCTTVSGVDLSGDWTISSSVGGNIPITVYCTLVQQGQTLSGTCTPEMENAEASTLRGSLDNGSASWGYSVVFNGNPGTVAFQADSISDYAMAGTLDLSGTMALFTAVKQSLTD